MEQLPTGFRFYPTEEELISFYLYNKLHRLKPEIDQIIPSIDIYNFEPSQLPEQASQLCHKDTEQWFFFMPQQEREARGGRPNRTTTTGYWKATGSPSYVYSSNKPIGVKKTMVFYMGKAPNGRKTKWKMNEYKAIKQEDSNCFISTNASTSIPTIPKLRHEVSLCRVYVTSGCARAFDRRPPPTAAAATTTTTTRTMTMTTTTTLNNINASSQDINNNCATTFGYNVEHGSGSNNQHAQLQTSNCILNVIMVEEKSSSPDDDSSNSGGDCHGTPQGPSTSTTERDNNSMTSTPIDFGMTESLDSFMDWEQLDWL